MKNKREAELVSAFMRIAQAEVPKFIWIRHEERLNSGVPDLSVTGNGKTTWWEFKHGTPGFESKGIQKLTCVRLAREGFCRYVIYQEDQHNPSRILIVHPRDIYDVLPEAWCIDFDHRFVLDYIRKEHSS